jgi:hypothetical protein
VKKKCAANAVKSQRRRQKRERRNKFLNPEFFLKKDL